MATLSSNTQNASSSKAADAQNAQPAYRGFRLTGEISNFKRGMTKATEKNPSKPYIRCKIDGETTTGKKILRTIMAFGEKAIRNLDVDENTATAGVFVAYDRRGRNGNILVPVGPYKAN